MKQQSVNYYKQVDIDCWDDFKCYSDKFPLGTIFRGQSDSNWDLNCSYERSSLFKSYRSEEVMINEFKKIAHFYISEHKMPMTNLAWLALMQHHGTPTRLIDFTKSPFIASYFAYEKLDNNSERVAIWCINKGNLYERVLSKVLDKIPDYKTTGNNCTFLDSDFDKITNQTGIECVIPFEIENPNERYYLQQSIFLVPASIEKRTIDQFENFPKEYNETITKITLPSNIYKEVLRDLLRMNITAASLFSSLDGYAKYIYMRHSILPTIDEIERNQDYMKRKGIF
ncbi:MAG: FRG domain-containing protein [Treponema sp.]|jgi:hypothetical protein|nr:FRG domain-containing protein [Treponema sp.]